MGIKQLGKGTAFVIGLALIMTMFVMAMVFSGRLSDNLIGSFLLAIVGLVSGYIGLKVTNNAVKGKCFSQGLWDAEHNKTTLTQGACNDQRYF